MKLIKVKTSQGCLGRNIGTEKAPDAVVKELGKCWSNEDRAIPNFNVEEAGVVSSNLEETFKNIESKSKEAFSKGERVFFIGGDHSIGYSTVKGFAKNFENPGIVVFDAHPDCYKTEGCDINTHEDYLWHLIKEGIIKGENVILIGARNADAKEWQFLKENKVRVFSMKSILNNREKVCDTVMETARGFGAMFLSIDIDAVDPAFAPGTGCAEPGGLSSRELIYFLQRLKLLKNFKGGELVEINPDKDVNGMTVKLGAKILTELA